MKRIVLIAGFETFNIQLYRSAAERAIARCPDLAIQVYSDRDLIAQPETVASALSQADVFFASLLFDYDQVMWLRERVTQIPIRLVFESALELMSLTEIGEFKIGDKPKGMPKPVKFILSKFSSGKEEDKLAGYISFLKTGPKLLKYVPVQKVQDLRNWLIIYGYWNAGGEENVASLFWTLGEQYLDLEIGKIPAPLETPNMGLLHPDYSGYFTSPKAYLEWYEKTHGKTHNGTVGILLYRKHVITKQPYIHQLIRAFEQDGLLPVPMFINGVEGHVAVRDWMTSSSEPSPGKEAIPVDAIASTIGFPLVGGPAGSMEAGRQIEVSEEILTAKNVPYLVAAPLLIQDIYSWTRQGIGGLQSVVLYALPELDGAIDTVPLGGLVGEDIYLIPERVKRLTGRLNRWIALRKREKRDRKIAILLYDFPPGYGATGTAALLDVPRSLLKVLQALKQEGYQVGELPEDGETLIRQVKEANENYDDEGSVRVTVRTLEKWLGYLQKTRMENQWKNLERTGIKTLGDEFYWGGVQLGNIWIGVQPPLGISGDPMRLLFERDLTPHPQYAAFYQWLEHEYRADAIVHFGMHGTVEWLPGSPLGNTGYSWSDILLGNMPNLYIYAANNPSESMLAKRRGYGVLISHNVPPYGRAGLYKELLSLRELIAEYREDTEKNTALREAIAQKILDTGLDRDCPLAEVKQLGIEFTVETVKLFSADVFNRYFLQVYDYLQVLETRLFSSGLHVLGEAPTAEAMESYLEAYFGEEYHRNSPEAERIQTLLSQNTDELSNLLRGLNGEYIPAAPGGDLLRDGAGVLPTGRNIYSLDPYRMPSPGAYERGKAIAKKLIEQHLDETGNYPETVAVMLWGLDTIKTKGESIGIVLELVGAVPVKEGTGRIVRYELIPLAELKHPRIDILGNLSGIFRDSFVNVIELLDDLFHRAAAADESIHYNYIRKHALELQAQGIESSAARLFSNPAGDFGSLVNDRVVESSWESGEELAQTWQSRNEFSYGRNDKGQARPEVLQKLLKTSDRIIQEIDSVEYGLTDIQEYYANTGGLKKAAETQQGKRVTTSVVESFSKDTTPRQLEEVLRMEYRTKLLNPKWAKAMLEKGSGGAYEISQRMTALMGWGGTTDFTENWVYDRAAESYALDTQVAAQLRDANPEAFRNIVGRLLEANGRGFWETSAETLEQLRELYDQAEAEVEGVEVAVSVAR